MSPKLTLDYICSELEFKAVHLWNFLHVTVVSSSFVSFRWGWRCSHWQKITSLELSILQKNQFDNWQLRHIQDIYVKKLALEISKTRLSFIFRRNYYFWTRIVFDLQDSFFDFRTRCLLVNKGSVSNTRKYILVFKWRIFTITIRIENSTLKYKKMKVSAILVAATQAAPASGIHQWMVDNWWTTAVETFNFATNEWAQFQAAVDSVSQFWDFFEWNNKISRSINPCFHHFSTGAIPTAILKSVPKN